MIREIRSQGMRLLLITALLWTQSVIAQHSADHLWHDVTEVCQVLVNADHTKILNSVVDHSVLAAEPAPFICADRPIINNHNDSGHLARSPPL